MSELTPIVPLNPPDVFTDWHPGDPKLPGSKVASTLRWLRAQIQALQAQGLAADGIADIAVAEGGRSFHLVTGQGVALPEIPLPASPWEWRPDSRVAGAPYADGDTFYVPATRSS
jgi:hypothetical protein